MKSKTLGILLLIPSIIIVLSIIAFAFLGLALGVEDVGWLGMIPALIMIIFFLALSIGAVYIAVRYIKGKAFKQNKNLGNLLIGLGIFYFIYKLAFFVWQNVFVHNYGFELHPVIGLVVGYYLAVLGIGLRPVKSK